MNKRALLSVCLIITVLVAVVIIGNSDEQPTNDEPTAEPTTEPQTEPTIDTEEPTEDMNHPRIASWLAKKDELIQSGKPYDLVMAGWFTPKEAAQLKANNPDVILLAGLTTTWVWDNEGWKQFLLTVASYGRDEFYEITEEMYLHGGDGARCAFGWASEEWGYEEIYGMDPRNTEWVELIISFYGNVLDQPQHDGIIVDMVVEKQYWCPDAITDEEWLEATKGIYRGIQELNTEDKPVIFNAGRSLSDIDEYGEFFDGFVLENFMGDQLKSTFTEGLEAAEAGYTVIYGVDTDDTGVVDPEKMRLGLTLSLLNDDTYFTYDFGPRDHGQAWWFDEYDADLGEPIGVYYEKEGAYWREYENGVVVAAPDGTEVSFTEEHTDVTTNQTSKTFQIEEDDGRIYLLNTG
ncbi:hypothetical protein JXL21_08175 [Candidatus Bathyarchaeota archaeon]|nr:hypothetical protein [Candidatus Bathyarchaeota archaeon]